MLVCTWPCLCYVCYSLYSGILKLSTLSTVHLTSEVCTANVCINLLMLRCTLESINYYFGSSQAESFFLTESTWREDRSLYPSTALPNTDTSLLLKDARHNIREVMRLINIISGFL